MRREQIDAPAQMNDVRSLINMLKQRGGAWEEVFGNDTLRITANKQFSDLSTPLKSGDEVAFIPAWLS